MFFYCIILGLNLLQQVHAGVGLFSLPSSNHRTVLAEINREAVSHIYSYPRLAEWCEIERSFNLASQALGIEFCTQLRQGICKGLQPQYDASPSIMEYGMNKRYGIFSTVNWTLMYDVENHRYATEFPSTVQVFHFKPESRPLTMKQEPGILDYNCPAVLPFDLPEDMPTPEEVKFK